MSKRFLAFILIFTVVFFTFSIFSQVHADCGSNDVSNNYDLTSSSSNCPPALTQITGVVVSIIEIILVLSGIVFFIMIVVNGYNFITAMGNPEKIENARKGLLFTVIGFGLIFGSFIIVSAIATFSGISGGFYIDPNTHSIKLNVLSTYTPTALPSDTLPTSTSTPAPTSDTSPTVTGPGHQQ